MAGFGEGQKPFFWIDNAGAVGRRQRSTWPSPPRAASWSTPSTPRRWRRAAPTTAGRASARLPPELLRRVRVRPRREQRRGRVPHAGVAHRGGSGPPLLPARLHRHLAHVGARAARAGARHDVLAPTLAGHAGGPPIEGEVDEGGGADAVERAMDEAGFETAHIAGNSLGGYVALQLAARGRARTSWRSRRPAAGRGRRLLPGRCSILQGRCSGWLRRPRRTRRRSSRHRRGAAARRQLITDELRAHPGRAARAPDARRRRLRRRPSR